MKNLNKVRNYTGNYIWFDNNEMMYKFIDLYKDMWIDYEFINDTCLKIICKAGVIPSIKRGLKNSIETKGHNRYYVKAS